MVATLVRTGTGIIDASDLLRFKSSNIVMLDSVTIDYNNTNVIQQRVNINGYLIFKQHTTTSYNDMLINTHTGYRKDDSSTWSYDDELGITNNPPVGIATFNNQFLKSDTQKNKVAGDINILRNTGSNYYQKVAGNLIHVFYYDCIIRLKDLPFFEKLPMVRGANIKIALTLNQCDFSFKNVFTAQNGNIAATNVKTLENSSFKGLTNPLLRMNGDLDGQNYTETISLKAVENNGYKHVKTQCRLYVPVYTMEPEFEKQYLSVVQRTIVYEDVYIQHYKNVKKGENFQLLLTNSISRVHKLVIIPMISKNSEAVATDGNGSLLYSAQESPFTTEPSTCSPCHISDFNVVVAGSNVYNQLIQYKYENYLNEMNGTFGVNANTETGACSSLISLEDYQNNYGYIVVDLSRRKNYDDKTATSVEIRGTISSAKNLDLLCYIVYSRDLKIDVVTGGVIEE